MYASFFPRNKIQAVIFDLDGTLVSSSLNFKRIKDAIACPQEEDILLFVERLKGAEKQSARAVIETFELEDAGDCECMPGAKSFVEQLHSEKYPMAIVTRNSEAATNIKLEKHDFPIDIIYTREHAPPKPNPQALLSIADQWNIPTTEIAYVGDYVYDVQAAHNADMLAFLFSGSTSLECYEHYQQNLTYIPKPKPIECAKNTV